MELRLRLAAYALIAWVAGCGGGAPAGSCPGASTSCGGDCVLVESDNLNCGACGAACPTGQLCSAGVCGAVCGQGYEQCGTACAALDHDPNNCGACGTVCKPAHGTAVCVAGQCGVQSCASGFGDCDGDASNGCETNLNTDVANCGGCGVTCAGINAVHDVCTAGQCGYDQCQAGTASCDGDRANGCEADLANDANNCGACNIKCTAGQSCTNGHCLSVCDSPLSLCGSGAGFCTLLEDDPSNCGACGMVCAPQHAAAKACSAGVCGYSSCMTGWADCDHDTTNGCEVCTDCDPMNCLGCGAVCAGVHVQHTTCTASGCAYDSCSPGWMDCDGNLANGCETDINDDPNHCGSCNGPAHICLNGHFCSSGICTP